MPAQRNRDVVAGFQVLKNLLVPLVNIHPRFQPRGPVMFFPLIAFSSYLHFIDLASAQINAPNCTEDLESQNKWVGSLSAGVRFVSITARSSHRAGVLFIVIQFARTKSLFGRSDPGGSMQQWQSVHAFIICALCAILWAYCSIQHPYFAIPKFILHGTI